MEINDQELIKKFQQAIGANLDKDQAIDFFAKLNVDEYGRLLDVFTNNEFPEIGRETKEKILIILQQLKEVIKAE
jgi:hypothetical protein